MAQNQDRPTRERVTDLFLQAPRLYQVFSIILACVFLVLLLWIVPNWQVPKSGLSLKDRLHQVNENRKTVAQIVGGVFILVGLYIAWVRSKALRDQAEVAREQQLTDLYVKAVEQLGSENLQIRLGGIYALERIARESPKDHWPIMEVLTAFVRENAPLKEKTLTEEGDIAEEASDSEIKAGIYSPKEKPPTDIQVVLTVLGRTGTAYAQKGEERSLDLRATHIAGANLAKANLTKADLSYSNLREADLSYALLNEVEFGQANIEGGLLYETDLQGAHFYKTNLQKAFLFGSNLQGAGLGSANLRGTNLMHSILQEAAFPEANLSGADLSYSNLQGAFLHSANLQGASLEEADLREASFVGANLLKAKGLTTDQISEAFWDETTKWPEGFSPPALRKEEEGDEE